MVPRDTHRRALSQFVCCHHLHIQVFGLGLPSGFDEPLKDLESNNTDYFNYMIISAAQRVPLESKDEVLERFG